MPPANPGSPRLQQASGFTKSHIVRMPGGLRPEPEGGARSSESFGLLALDPAVGSRAQERSLPDELVFFSWWNEEVAIPPELTTSGFGMGVRRQMQVKYLTHEGVFQLMTDDARVPITLRIEHANGSPMQATELHIGARIDILGRPTTLQKANARTIAWIDAEAKRLLKRREALCDQLSKFGDVHKLLQRRGIARLYLANASKPDEKVHPRLGGETNLSRITTEVKVLEELLMQHRG